MAMKTNRMLLVVLLALTAGFFTQCKKASKVDPDDENELITTIRLHFKQNGTTSTFEWKDNDGDGGNAPDIDQIRLKANTTYELTTEFIDGSKTPAEDITEEILEKADEHLVVYTPAPASLLTYTYGDKDSRNLGIGLTGTLVTGNTGQGTLKVQLRHQPPVNGVPVKNGTAGPGSDDALVDFDVVLE